MEKQKISWNPSHKYFLQKNVDGLEDLLQDLDNNFDIIALTET